MGQMAIIIANGDWSISVACISEALRAYPH